MLSFISRLLCRIGYHTFGEEWAIGQQPCETCVHCNGFRFVWTNGP